MTVVPFKMKHEIKYDLITQTLNRPGRKAPKRRFGVIHDTGNKNSTAKNNRDYLNRKNIWKTVNGKQVPYEANGKEEFRKASAHVFVDDKEIVVCIPFDELAWHVRYEVPKDNHMFGGDANDIAEGYELCFFDDLDRSLKAYEKFVWLVAWRCHVNGWDPEHDLVGHDVLDPGRKIDPTNAFKRIGVTWSQFIEHVKDEIRACTGKEEKKVAKTEMTQQWEKEAHEYVTKNGISDGTRPFDNVTRVEVWAMMKRFEYKLQQKFGLKEVQ